MKGLRISDWIARQEEIDGSAKPVQGAVQQLFSGDGRAMANLENFLHGRWLGHPLHSAIVHIPIGAWTMAAILDLFCSRSGARAAADWAIAIGLIFAIPAVITGLADWHLYNSNAIRRIGFVHMMANLTAFVLYVISYALRGGPGLVWPLITGYLGFACLAISGYLGGVMVYERRVGVNHGVEAEDSTAPDEFVTVMNLADLPLDKPTKVQVGDEFAVLVLTKDRIYAMAEKCSHEGGPLSEGTLVDACLVCPWHATAFRLEDGQAMSGPGVYSQPVFEVYIREDEIRVKAVRTEEPQIASSPISQNVRML